MATLIKLNWTKLGLSKKSLSLQKVLSYKNGVLELLNTKHGIITYVTL